MLIKLLSSQLATYKEIINECIDKSMPGYEEKIKTDLYKEILLDLAQVWLYHNDEDKFEGILITQIRNSISVGAKTFTLVCMHAPEGTNNAAFINSWPKLQAFGKKHGCEIFDFYTNNDDAIKYARLFNIILETTYFQIDINK